MSLPAETALLGAAAAIRANDLRAKVYDIQADKRGRLLAPLAVFEQYRRELREDQSLSKDECLWRLDVMLAIAADILAVHRKYGFDATAGE